MTMRYIAVALALVGCAAIEIPPDAGRHITIQHGSARFNATMQAVRDHCNRMGLAARHIRSGGGGYTVLSSFECVER